MASEESDPFFSIIITTRDRPELFQIALQSVLDQSFPRKEVIVVIDGSTDENMARYEDIENAHRTVRFLKLVNRPNGHGHSYAMNFGTDASCGRFLCFLDDDDHWTDNGYLVHVFESISASQAPVDMHYSNQRAIHTDGVMQDGVWLDDLVPRAVHETRNAEDSYRVDTHFLLSGSGFAHLNCSIFERQFYASIGGMDESIRYEDDRDIFIRSIDAASVILFSTRYTSLHNIPDIKAKQNLSTVSSDIQKKLYQMHVYDKGISQSKRQEVVAFCGRSKVYEMKHVATILARDKRFKSAAFYARSALLSGFNPRWLAYTLYLTIQSWLKPRVSSSEKSS
jgi:glycosyltransferase involved in cell wall biosynthesis